MQRADGLKTIWREASALKRGLIVGVPIVVLALCAAAIGLAFSGGGSSSAEEGVQQPTQAATDTTAPTPALTPLATETPASAGTQATDQQPPAGSATGSNVRRAAPPNPALSGPGAIEGTGMSMSIPAIGVNASVYSRTIGENGQMGNPSGAWDVIWYDFSAWQGMGGYPGEPGANAVFAGHVDYIHVGPAVFWSIRDLSPGDEVTVNTSNGPVRYAIQWSQWTDPDIDFTQFVTKTGQDSITLVTCIGGFSAGHYSNRLIVRGVRV